MSNPRPRSFQTATLACATWLLASLAAAQPAAPVTSGSEPAQRAPNTDGSTAPSAGEPGVSAPSVTSVTSEPPVTSEPSVTSDAQAAPLPAAADPAAEATPSVDAAATPASSASAASDAPTVPMSATTRVASAALCLSASTGVTPSDALTTAALVCEALRQRGAHVDPDPKVSVPAGASSAYRVALRSLGTLRLLEVSFESPIGTRVDARSVELARIEEVPVAAPRLAESLLTGKPLSETAKPDTLVGAETRTHEKKSGELLVGIGVLGFAVPDSDVTAGYGVFGQLYYETADYAVGAELRGGGSDAGDASLIGISLGARYFLTSGDIAPFVGGGLGVLWLEHDDSRESNEYSGYDYDEYSGSGLALHAEVGVEFLRLHGARFDIRLRVDAPLFSLSSHDYDLASADDRYALPISLMAAYSFD